ncbi:MAG TPA: ABC transporter ATP-binding protein [Ferruginibacter sp.]|nr:hypothetical protein [Chitinophagaceae bacterium]HRI23742.1 ABC transporter ATP-binding protein [Ferruginibacter sp.]
MKRTLQNILRVLNAKEKNRFFLLLALDLLINITDIVFLAGLIWIIQFYIQPEQASRLSFLPDPLANRDSVIFIALFVLLFTIKNWAAYLVSRAQFRFTSGVAIRLSGYALTNYQRAPFHEFINTDSSVHLRNICFRPFDFCQYILSGTQQIITQLSLMLITVIAILLFNAKLFFLLLLILLPPVVAVFWFMKKKLAITRRNIQEHNERSFRYVLDALKGWVEGNIYARNDFFQRRFVRARKIFSVHLFDSFALQSMPGRVIEIFAVLGLFILVVIIKWTGNADHSMLVTVGAFMAAAYKIIPGMVKIVNLGGQMKAYEFSLDETEEREPAVAKTAGNPPGTIHSVELRDIHFQYGDQKVLQNFSLTIQPGDFIGISGISGKGKTTLFNLLLGFLEPARGSIYINGEAIKSRDIKDYWPWVAYVRQQGFFIHDTMMRNITLEEEAGDQQKLADAILVAGLDKLSSVFPEGIEKVITENGKNISGGQQQRIALARALYKDAPFMLLDEPFNELDEDATLTLLHHFKKLAASGKAILMITHDKKSLSFCTKTISLDEQE